MNSDLTPEPNNHRNNTRVDYHETLLSDSAKFLEKLFNSVKSIDNKSTRKTKLKQLPEQVIQNLHQTISEEEILITTVEEVRRVIDCDRALIYSLLPSSQGKVIAEAVIPGWTPALGQIVEDPYLATKYLKTYQNGGFQTVNNIYKAGITQDDIEQLGKLEVKAAVLVPIWQQENLFGLLVAHQCSQPRIWQSEEIKYVQQIAIIARLALERAQLIEEREKLKQQAESEAQWTQFFAQTIPYIYQSLQEKDVLKATVREARRILNCDRVVVYGLNSDQYAEVIAESVASGWTKALGKVIEDPCFEARYIEKYEYGRVKAIDNIYEAGMSECYLEQLEKLEVKANLVTPIINEGKLLGLLVAHQCSQPRQWQQYEIRWLTQIALQAGFALDNGKLVHSSTHLQRQADNQAKWIQYLKELIDYLRQHSHQEEILETTVQEARRILDCDRVVVYSLNRDYYGEVIAESVASGWTKSLGKVIEDPCFEVRYIEKYQDGRVKAMDNIYEAGMSECYLEQLEKLEVKANLVTPIVKEGKIFGLLVAHHCGQPHKWQSEEIEFLSQLAINVGLELQRAKLIAEREHLQQQVQNEAQWAQLFTQIVQYLRQSLKQEDILQTSVEEVRRLLNCDRVVVYSLNQDYYREVIAESVAPGWTKALGKAIEDPCFEARYMEKYQDGRVQAIDNIYEAEITPYYLEQLEKLEVKANLVTPILAESKIFGLLVAHQCSQTRIWQQYELRWVSQISTQVGFALENAKLRQQLEQSSLTKDYLAHEHDQKIEALKQQVVKVLRDSTTTYQTLAQDALSQSETFIEILQQIEEITNAVKNQVVDIQQVQLQKQQHNLQLQVIQKTVNLTWDSVSTLQESVNNANTKIDYLSNSSQKLLEILHLIQDSAKQIAQQSLNVTIAISGTDNTDSESIIELTDALLSSVQQLYKAIARINPLLAGIDNEVCTGKTAIDSAMQEVVTGTELVQDTRQKLEQMIAVNVNVGFLVDKVVKDAESQLSVSTSAGQSIQNVVNLANRISEHSLAITESFNQMIALTQEF